MRWACPNVCRILATGVIEVHKSFEVIVVGGGIVGATVACLLGQGGIETALLERGQPPRQFSPEPIDNRVSALTRASQNILQATGAWAGMKKRGISPYRKMRVWDGAGDGELYFDCTGIGFDELGHIVENRVTVAALWDVLQTLSSVSLIHPAQVTDLQVDANGHRVYLEDGRIFNTRLVLAADGRDSALRQMAGIPVTGWAYQQDGLVATVTTRDSHQATAWQRFLDTGPLAFLPLWNGQSSIVWSLPTDTARQYRALPEAEFLQQLQQASAGILGDILETGPRSAFALRFQYANRYIAESFALLGDAAHAMHPLAGQGANAGLLDAAAIAELMLTARAQNRPLSSQRVLRKYERWRKGDNLLMMSTMDALKKIYDISLSPFVALRCKGMNIINRSFLLKNWINQYAMGLRDDLPQLARRV